MKLDDHMKKIREELYINACKDLDLGMKVSEICKKHGISEGAFYAWKKRFYGVSRDKIDLIRTDTNNVKNLKRKIKQQQEEINVLKAALKKKF